MMGEWTHCEVKELQEIRNIEAGKHTEVTKYGTHVTTMKTNRYKQVHIKQV